MLLQTHRLKLRAIEPDDIDIVYQIENDTSLWCVGRTTAPLSHKVLRDYLLQSTADIYSDGQLRLVMENSQGQPVGMIDLTRFEPRHLRAEVGIVVFPAHRGKGYASDALALIIDYASTFLHLHQLYALVPLNNEPSMSLFRRSRFQQQAILKDWIATDRGFLDVALMQLFLNL